MQRQKSDSIQYFTTVTIVVLAAFTTVVLSIFLSK